MLTESSVIFRGTKEGLKVIMDQSADLTKITADLVKKIRESHSFFEGTKVNLIFTGKSIEPEEFENIIDILSKEVDLGSAVFEVDRQVYPAEDHFEGLEEGLTRFYKGTVRSGQRIKYSGNIVIIGDVNPGGEIVAGGNIIVMGILRGLAHAGALGNNQAVVCAFDFRPTQLRIANLITRPPEDDSVKPNYPEIAFVKNDILLIEPYLPTRAK